jgi:acyl-CoA hydrolase
MSAVNDKKSKPVLYSDLEQCASAILEAVGNHIVLGLPLGIGKPNHLVNALFQRAVADNTLQLTIVTALSLQAPRGSSLPEQRFLEPIRQRLYAEYPELEYVKAQKTGKLPPNIQIIEFYTQPGSRLGVPDAQRHILYSNYTHVVRDLLALGVNLIVQSVAQATVNGDLRYSLACNPDITLDLLSALHADQTRKVFVVGQVNDRLPFMGAAAALEPETFDAILAGAAWNHEPFSTINMPVDNVEHMIGLYASRLIRDGGTLQLGIGEIGDAVAHSLNLRHADNAVYRRILDTLSVNEKFGAVIAACGEDGIFSQGLYGLTELLSDALWFLYRRGILKRKVYPDRQMGGQPENGSTIDAAFCLGSRAFYAALRQLDPAATGDIRMHRVSFTNELYGDNYFAKRAQRSQARFINSGLKATLTGGVASDGLANGQVISGVGGQYNFVAMAHALPDARSILTIKSTRGQGASLESNIVWNYGHITIPRHLRDIVITEYGIADLRSRTDEQIIIELLKITDSRFQQGLLKTAQRAGKLHGAYRLPAIFRNNYPEALAQALAPLRAHFPEYPVGTDFTAEEQALLPVLENLKALQKDKPALFKALARAAVLIKIPERLNPLLERMQLHNPRTLQEHSWRKILAQQLLEIEEEKISRKVR